MRIRYYIMVKFIIQLRICSIFRTTARYASFTFLDVYLITQYVLYTPSRDIVGSVAFRFKSKHFFLKTLYIHRSETFKLALKLHNNY